MRTSFVLTGIFLLGAYALNSGDVACMGAGDALLLLAGVSFLLIGVALFFAVGRSEPAVTTNYSGNGGGGDNRIVPTYQYNDEPVPGYGDVSIRIEQPAQGRLTAREVDRLTGNTAKQLGAGKLRLPPGKNVIILDEYGQVTGYTKARNAGGKG